jgi:hypothetical protein
MTRVTHYAIGRMTLLNPSTPKLSLTFFCPTHTKHGFLRAKSKEPVLDRKKLGSTVVWDIYQSLDQTMQQANMLISKKEKNSIILIRKIT